MKVITILGTRPEITKLSPLLPLLDSRFNHKVIHTGQHYDHNMDTIFFEELNLRKPDYQLNVGSKSHAEQTAEMMVKIEKILQEEKPDGVIVFADPNTPLAGALVASKLHIPLIHLEAGCRSFNKKMPEEINRIVCDHCADILLAPDNVAYQNLLKEGLSSDKIIVVGSTAWQSSLRNLEIAREKSQILSKLGLEKENYVLLTIHRAENTTPEILPGLVSAINKISERIQIIFPRHPRTKNAMAEQHLEFNKNVTVIEPVGYLDMLVLLKNAYFVMTGSGGLQEEAAALNTPCLIIRNETEWTYLTDIGKNMLVSNEEEQILEKVNFLLDNPENIKKMKNVQLDLNTNIAERILEVLLNEFKE